MSKIEVDKIDPQSGTALEIGTSGDTVTVPSGVGLTLTDSTLLLPTTINTDKIDPKSGTALEIGTSGDTITVPTGAGLTVTDEVKTNKISPATGVAFTLGDSGDTFTVPSGATIDNLGTATGFGGGAWTLIETQTASADATIDFTTLSADYIDFKIICSNVVPATDGQGGWFRLSTSSSFLTSGYAWAMSGSDQDAAVKTNGAPANSTHINVNYSGIGNTVGENLYCEFTVSDVHDTVNQKMCSFTSSYGDSTPDFEQIRGGGTHPATTAAIDGLQFLFSAGNVTSGEFTLYGRKVT
jgi:hypothetical protein